MNKDVTREQVETALGEQFEDERGNNPAVEIRPIGTNGISIAVRQMYQYVEVSFAKMEAMSKLLDTKNIDLERYSREGCETCDYGSSYEVTFIAWPDGEKRP